MIKTEDGFDYAETDWTYLPPEDEDKDGHYVTYGVGFWNDIEMIRVPGVLTESEFNEANPKTLRDLHENLIATVNDMILLKLGWPPYHEMDLC